MSSADSRVGSAFGKYRLRRLLGSGGMGDVYEAYDTTKDRTVALKILKERFSENEQFRARFQRESHAAAILQEPHVIPIHDWGEIDGSLYIDMRLVPGQTLYDLIAAAPMAPKRAVAIVKQIAAALDAAHSEGLIHRDVKPQNILVTADDFAYLVDFGIAESSDETHLTMAGERIGSLDYMAPERFGDRPTTAATDTYALACVLYQALTGHPPFPRHSLEQSMAAHLQAPPPSPSTEGADIPVALDQVIARGMAKDPDDRYPSAGALALAARRALRDAATAPAAPVQAQAQAATLLATPPVHPVPPPPAYPPPATATERSTSPALIGVLAGLAAVLLAAVGVLAGMLLSGRSDLATAPPLTSQLTPTSYAAPTPRTPPATTATTKTSTKTVTVSSTATPPRTTAPTGDSVQQLRALAGADHDYVAAMLADQWVPQLSSKRPGVVDGGIVWDNDLTLREHLQLRRHYPSARLLWSGDWSTFSGPDFWVTVVGITYPDADGALEWCRTQGFDPDHCIAKKISRTATIDGSTAYN